MTTVTDLAILFVQLPKEPIYLIQQHLGSSVVVKVLWRKNGLQPFDRSRQVICLVESARSDAVGISNLIRGLLC